MKKHSIKGILSTLLIVTFLLLAFTGALLYFGRTGMVWGISRNLLREIHFWSAVSMCALVSVHLLLNFRVYKKEMKSVIKGARVEGD